MLRRFIQVAALSLPFIVGSISQASVWQATNSWNQQWEQRFATFINETKLDIFSNEKDPNDEQKDYEKKRNNPFYGIGTDCADAAYTLRVIFAQKNKLPVNFYNYDGLDLSNETSKYDDIADDHERLLKFIRFVNWKTDTSTMITETYPIAINSRSVVPGTMFLHSPRPVIREIEGKSVDTTPVSYRSAHVVYVHDVSSNGAVTYIGSTVPVAVRNLNVRFGFPHGPLNENSGYRAWKWPNTQGQPLGNRLNGSLEQYEIANWISDVYASEEKSGYKTLAGRKLLLQKQDEAWMEDVKGKLKGSGSGKKITPDEEYNAVIGNIANSINERIAAVNEGWAYYNKTRYVTGKCMKEGDYKNYSTPTRDERIQIELKLYLRAAAIRKLWPNKSIRLDKPLTTQQNKEITKLLSKVTFQVLPEVFVDLNHIYRTFLIGNNPVMISEPEHRPEVRWGIEPMKQSEAVCPERVKAYIKKGDR